MGHEFQSALRRWDVVAGLCQSIDAKTYVEIGCREGRTTGFVLANCPDLMAIAVDPWVQQSVGDDPARESYSGWDFAEIERKFWENVGEHKWRCEQLRMTGVHAAEHYHDNGHLLDTSHGLGFDVVFIDALHDYESVLLDIAHWRELVNVGGYIAGHDYQHRFPGVMKAVAEHFNLMDVCLGPDSTWWVKKTQPCCPNGFGAQV